MTNSKNTEKTEESKPNVASIRRQRVAAAIKATATNGYLQPQTQSTNKIEKYERYPKIRFVLLKREFPLSKTTREEE